MRKAREKVDRYVKCIKKYHVIYKVFGNLAWNFVHETVCEDTEQTTLQLLLKTRILPILQARKLVEFGEKAFLTHNSGN